MALYFVHGGPGGSALLVRARNGDQAVALSGLSGPAARVTEDGPDGVLGFDGGIDGAPVSPSPAAESAGKEIEITSISDRSRRFKNVETGEEREEPFRPAD